MMGERDDASNAVIHPPIAWALAIVAGLGGGWLYPLRFVPPTIPRIGVGGSLFIIAFLLAVWAIVTIRRAGTQIRIDKPTTMIVTDGPFGFTRNPIYLGMLLGQAGLAVAFDNVWLLVAWAPLYLVFRYGVISREEAYLDRKFAAAYRAYKLRVRRWV